MRMTTPKRYAKKILYLFARPLMPVKLDPPRPSKGFILTPKPISELPESNTRFFFKKGSSINIFLSILTLSTFEDTAKEKLSTSYK